MTDLKILNLNKNSDKYLFRKKLSLRRKSKRKLIKESFIMLSFGILIIYLNYLIPNKNLVFSNFLVNFSKLFNNILISFSYIYEIFLVVFMIFSIILTFILLFGYFSRVLKILKRKS